MRRRHREELKELLGALAEDLLGIGNPRTRYRTADHPELDVPFTDANLAAGNILMDLLLENNELGAAEALEVLLSELEVIESASPSRRERLVGWSTHENFKRAHGKLLNVIGRWYRAPIRDRDPERSPRKRVRRAAEERRPARTRRGRLRA